jgi:arginyl-tRNA synthetase
MKNLEKVILNIVKELGYDAKAVAFQKTKHEKHGDLSTPIAMQIAKKYSKIQWKLPIKLFQIYQLLTK